MDLETHLMDGSFPFISLSSWIWDQTTVGLEAASMRLFIRIVPLVIQQSSCNVETLTMERFSAGLPCWNLSGSDRDHGWDNDDGKRCTKRQILSKPWLLQVLQRQALRHKALTSSRIPIDGDDFPYDRWTDHCVESHVSSLSNSRLCQQVQLTVHQSRNRRWTVTSKLWKERKGAQGLTVRPLDSWCMDEKIAVTRNW